MKPVAGQGELGVSDSSRGTGSGRRCDHISAPARCSHIDTPRCCPQGGVPRRSSRPGSWVAGRRRHSWRGAAPVAGAEGWHSRSQVACPRSAQLGAQACSPAGIALRTGKLTLRVLHDFQQQDRRNSSRLLSQVEAAGKYDVRPAWAGFRLCAGRKEARNCGQSFGFSSSWIGKINKSVRKLMRPRRAATPGKSQEGWRRQAGLRIGR